MQARGQPDEAEGDVRVLLDLLRENETAGAEVTVHTPRALQGYLAHKETPLACQSTSPTRRRRSSASSATPLECESVLRLASLSLKALDPQRGEGGLVESVAAELARLHSIEQWRRAMVPTSYRGGLVLAWLA